MAHTTGKSQQKGAGGVRRRTITFAQLQELCDQPSRDLPGGRDVRALLTLDTERGFFLAAQDGAEIYEVVDEHGEPMRFRTIESAIAHLNHVHGLSADIGLFIAPAARVQH
jgi:hypothetical protein